MSDPIEAAAKIAEESAAYYSSKADRCDPYDKQSREVFWGKAAACILVAQDIRAITAEDLK